MAKWLHDHRVFWGQFRQQFHTTGAVLPSGRFLCRALARYVGQTPEGQASQGRRILEVGPGTGAATAQIVRRLRPNDHFDLVELNAEFVRRLNERFASEEPFRKVASQTRILHQPVEQLPADTQYDLIISGLPLNNFEVAQVEKILNVFLRLLRPGGTLSFFEYIAIRPARSLLSGSAERKRLQGISLALTRVLGPHEFRRDWVLPNVLPAWVHHVRLPAKANS